MAAREKAYEQLERMQSAERRREADEGYRAELERLKRSQKEYALDELLEREQQSLDANRRHMIESAPPARATIVGFV
jgi:hypothetical protein